MCTHTEEGQREREKENPKQSLHYQIDVGLNLTNHKTMIQAKTYSRILNQMSHPGAPLSAIILNVNGPNFPSEKAEIGRMDVLF